MARRPDGLSRWRSFYNQRGTAERWIREGMSTARLSCRRFATNALRLQKNGGSSPCAYPKSFVVPSIGLQALRVRTLRSSIVELQAAINRFLAEANDDPKPSACMIRSESLCYRRYLSYRLLLSHQIFNALTEKLSAKCLGGMAQNIADYYRDGEISCDD
jgi:hypothetical protein